MTVCAVNGCHNSSGKSKEHCNITFHLFPSDPTIAARWIDKIKHNRNDINWEPSKRTKICSKHFDETDKYTTKGGLCRLRPDAVPSKNIPIFVEVEKNVQIVELMKDEPQPSTSHDCTNLQTDSPAVSVFDTPEYSLLRTTLTKKTLLQEHTQECKERWHKLRNCYNNAMKRRQVKVEKKFAPWRYEDQMSFIKPFWIRNSTTQDSTEDEDPLSTECNGCQYDDGEEASSESLPRTVSPTTSTSLKRKAPFKSEHNLSDEMDIMNSETRHDSLDYDELDCFFLSMSKAVKKLPKTDQIRVKMDLHKAVCEAELKHLEAQSQIQIQAVQTKSEYVVM